MSEKRKIDPKLETQQKMNEIQQKYHSSLHQMNVDQIYMKKTQNIVYPLINLYHHSVAHNLRFFNQFITLDPKNPRKIKSNTIPILLKNKSKDRIEFEKTLNDFYTRLHTCVTFLDDVYVSMELFSQLQLLNISPYFMRTTTYVHAVITGLEGTIDMTKWSPCLFTLPYVFKIRFDHNRVHNEYTIWNAVNDEKEYFSQFKVNPPKWFYKMKKKKDEEYEKLKKAMDMNNKKRAKDAKENKKRLGKAMARKALIGMRKKKMKEKNEGNEKKREGEVKKDEGEVKKDEGGKQ